MAHCLQGIVLDNPDLAYLSDSRPLQCLRCQCECMPVNQGSTIEHRIEEHQRGIPLQSSVQVTIHPLCSRFGR